MTYIFNATTKKYYKDDIEITQEEYEESISLIKESFDYALRKYNGETVEVPDNLKEMVEIQLIALNENVPDEEELTDIETFEILLGGVV